MGVFGVDVVQKFQASYFPEPMSGCWLWVGNLHAVSGHGRFSYEGKTEYAHRVSYVIHSGVIDDEVVRHTCDVAYCVNPDHLITGTRADNMDDMHRRGRGFQKSKTECKNGHDFSPENTKLGRNNTRICVECDRTRKREYARRKRAQ